jgi:hypothetical protein
VSNAVATGLFVFGYPVSIGVIVRWVPVVRERRIKWFIAHQLAVGAIVSGWALEGATQAVVINGSWFLVAALWYALGGRSRARGAGGAGEPFSSTA